MYKKRFSSKRRGRPFQKKGNFKRGGRLRKNQNIDFSRFINKSANTEEAEHFIPEHHFEDFMISDTLKKNIIAKGYKLPTPIQDRTIPCALEGRDLVGIANTGTGKTAAFLIPLIDKALKNPSEQIIIIAPTRELAFQINGEFRDFTAGMNLFSVCAVGGAYIGLQIRALRNKNNFIIGTPGRLKDLIERKYIKLSNFSTLVLDEADRMLDMGFVGDMRFIVLGMPAIHHTLFFSATLSREIESLISEFLKKPARISVKTGDTPKNVEQDEMKIGRGKIKLDVLHNLLNDKEFSKVLIFGRTKHGVESLSCTLAKRGFKAESIHGNKNHIQRQRALKRFKENQTRILVATDVAARGLDIDGISHVINYDLPATYDDYVHRIGRTGRGINRGKALTFIE